MINQSKPASGQAQTELLIGSGYALLIGDGFHLIINPENLTAGLTNAARPAEGETWANDSETWAQDTETWVESASLMRGVSKPTSAISNISKPV